MPRARREPSEESDEEEDEVSLAAFTTRSTRTKRSPRGAPGPAVPTDTVTAVPDTVAAVPDTVTAMPATVTAVPAAQPSAADKPDGATTPKSAPPPAQPLPSLPVVPYVGRVELEDVEFCHPDAPLESQMHDAEKLLKAFETGVRHHEALISKAVAKVEERCTAQKKMEKREAVEAATLAAIQTTELRMNAEQRARTAEHQAALSAAVAAAVAETQAAAQLAQQKAVNEAVRQAEERAAEQQRVVMLATTSANLRAVGRPEEEVAASAARFNFQEAASAAAAALEASSSLLARDADQESPTSVEADVSMGEVGAQSALQTIEDGRFKQPTAAADKAAADSLQFF